VLTSAAAPFPSALGVPSRYSARLVPASATAGNRSLILQRCVESIVLHPTYIHLTFLVRLCPPKGYVLELPRGVSLKEMRKTESRAKPLISIIDDDESFRVALTDLMEALGFAAEAFASAEGFLRSPTIHDTACLITDVHMPGMTGTELHCRLVKSGRAIPTILITAYATEDDQGRALAEGVVCYLSKPLDEPALLDCVRMALGRGRSKSPSGSRRARQKK